MQEQEYKVGDLVYYLYKNRIIVDTIQVVHKKEDNIECSWKYSFHNNKKYEAEKLFKKVKDLLQFLINSIEDDIEDIIKIKTLEIKSYYK